MREILFRGKRLDNGKWVEGAFCPKDCDDPFGPMVDKPSIIKLEEPGDGFWFYVEPATVGQFIGLTDKNGKRIFEGDVLGSRYDDLYPEDITVERIVWFRNAWHRIEGNYDPALIEEDDVLPYSEIIGNIHDNPELLEGGDPQ